MCFLGRAEKVVIILGTNEADQDERCVNRISPSTLYKQAKTIVENLWDYCDEIVFSPPILQYVLLI